MQDNLSENELTISKIVSEFKPKFYWTGNFIEDAERINRPHIKAEGPQEDRIEMTAQILNMLDEHEEITWSDALNIQNQLLKDNNWKGIVPGIRSHNARINEYVPPAPADIADLIRQMFPVKPADKVTLLEWYRQVQMIHPLSDLNGRVFGIIVALMYRKHTKKHHRI